jgi:hypothetical protein
MPGLKLPGVLCVVTKALPVDAGTLAVTASSPPGTVGAAADQHLSDYDLDFIRSTAGRNIDGSVKPLPELQHFREGHIRRQAEATRLFGAQSYSALFEQATVERLSALIEAAQSPPGRLAEKLDALIEQAQQPGSAVTDEQLSQAVAAVLGAERQRQLLGVSDPNSGGSDSMALVVKASNVFADRKNAALKGLIERAKLPGSPVRDEQLTQAVAAVLGAERQRQLLGIADADSGGSDGMALVVEASNVFADRKNAALKNLIEKYKATGSPVTDEQLSQAVAAVLGVERQRQLLGVPDAETGASASTALVVDAAKASLERKRATLAKLYESDASEDQITRATADYENAKTQLRRLGVSVPDAAVSTGPMKLGSRAAKDR